MEFSDLNDLIRFYYQSSEYDESEGQNKTVLTSVFDFQVYAKVTETSFTAYFKFKELGNENMKRFHTTELEFDETQTLIIEHKSNKYKVLRFENKDDGFMLYDCELMIDDE